MCQYVNQQRCRAKAALTGGSSWLSMGKEAMTFSKTIFPKPRCSIGLTFYTARLLIGSQNRWPFISVLLRNIQWTPSSMTLWKFLSPVKRWPTELSVTKMHVSISSWFFFEAIYISIIGHIFVTKYSLSAGFWQQGSRLDFESRVAKKFFEPQ